MHIIRVKLKVVRVFISVAMSNDWIDGEGFRANVGIILTDVDGKLMLAGRAGSKGWQFPQGGVLVGEDPEEAMYRELREEVGLERTDVELLGVTSDWLRYRLPDKFVRRNKSSAGSCCISPRRRKTSVLTSVSSPNSTAFAGLTTGDPSMKSSISNVVFMPAPCTNSDQPRIRGI